MKYLIILILALSAYANYIKKEKVGICENLTVHLNAKKCGQDCIKISKNYNCNYSKVEKKKVQDFNSPIWANRSMINSCSGEQDCSEKRSSLTCIDERQSYVNAEFTEVWCNKIIGYELIETDEDIVVVDEQLKATYEANKLAKDQLKNAIKQAKAAMECGKDVKALLMVRNATKGLSKGQIKQMLSTYSEIDSLLESGSLVTAKDEIQGITVDGVLITEQDKTALIAQIDSCIN